MFVGNRYHLSYCTNIHPGPDWKTTFDSLKEYVPKVKSVVAPTELFGLGLRLSNRASEELAQGEHLPDFKRWLEEEGSYVYTMNGFPYGTFHGQAVKDKVHLPDWTNPNRLNYTCRLFEQMAFLIPADMEGGISTSPISYKPWYDTDQKREKTLTKAVEQLVILTAFLRELEETTGCYLHLDMEPEPDGFLENTEDVLNFFKNYLLPEGSRLLSSQLSLSRERAEELLLRYICICYDICHFSLAYEDPEHTFTQWDQLGIKVGKIQISAALKVLANSDSQKIWNDLSQFDEPTYLHQVTQLVDNSVVTYPDLPALLELKPEFKEFRAHFHVPIFLESYETLYSTQDHIESVFAYLKDHHVTNHLEIETYTWDVLPNNLKTELDSSIAREFEWVLQRLQP